MTIDGTIVLTVDSLSPFAIVVDNGAPPASTGKVSPKTGVSEMNYVAYVITFVVLGSAAVAFSKKTAA